MAKYLDLTGLQRYDEKVKNEINKHHLRIWTNTNPKNKSAFTSTWTSKSWSGSSSFTGINIWSDGDNVYYSYSTSQLMLDKAQNKWNSKTWNGLTAFTGQYIWSDGENIYYSFSGGNYKLNKLTSTWVSKSWTNAPANMNGKYIWTDGINIYYSEGSKQYKLNKADSSWETVTWTGDSSFYGTSIWTDGNNVYKSSGSVHHVLNKEARKWETKTWTGLTNFSGGDIWTDGNLIYHSNATTGQYVLDVSTSTWRSRNWTGLTSLYAFYIWTDGVNIYYSNGSSIQYTLIRKDAISLPSNVAKKDEDNHFSADQTTEGVFKAYEDGERLFDDSQEDIDSYYGAYGIQVHTYDESDDEKDVNLKFPYNKPAGTYTLATLDDISGGGSGGKLYRHDINMSEQEAQLITITSIFTTSSDQMDAYDLRDYLLAKGYTSQSNSLMCAYDNHCVVSVMWYDTSTTYFNFYIPNIASAQKTQIGVGDLTVSDHVVEIGPVGGGAGVDHKAKKFITLHKDTLVNRATEPVKIIYGIKNHERTNKYGNPNKKDFDIKKSNYLRTDIFESNTTCLLPQGNIDMAEFFNYNVFDLDDDIFVTDTVDGFITGAYQGNYPPIFNGYNEFNEDNPYNKLVFVATVTGNSLSDLKNKIEETLNITYVDSIFSSGFKRSLLRQIHLDSINENKALTHGHFYIKFVKNLEKYNKYGESLYGWKGEMANVYLDVQVAVYKLANTNKAYIVLLPKLIKF